MVVLNIDGSRADNPTGKPGGALYFSMAARVDEERWGSAGSETCVTSSVKLRCQRFLVAVICDDITQVYNPDGGREQYDIFIMSIDLEF